MLSLPGLRLFFCPVRTRVVIKPSDLHSLPYDRIATYYSLSLLISPIREAALSPPTKFVAGPCLRYCFGSACPFTSDIYGFFPPFLARPPSPFISSCRLLVKFLNKFYRRFV